MSERVDKVILNDEELIERCYKIIKDLCNTGGQSWKLHVPVDFNNDPDMLLIELIKRFEKLKNEQGSIIKSS